MLGIIISIFAVVVGALAFAVHYSLDKKIIYKDLRGKHVLVTGGSSGIGKALAIEAARLGAHVSIIGRDQKKLKNARDKILSARVLKDEQKITPVPIDVTSNYEVLEKCLSRLEADVGPIFMLVNSAGMCICGQFENMKTEDIKQMVDVNYFGTAYPTKYVLPGMKQRNEGVIVFVSTEAALLGIYGYSAYGASKWAVRGLAEALLMELVGTKVSLTLAFPPDTDTPGFQTEELTKPKETKLISGTAGLCSAEAVGKKMLHDAMNGKTYSVFGTTGMLMSTLFCGSIDSATQVLLQVLTMGFLRAIVVPIVLSFHKIVRDGLKEKRQETVKSK